jgi:hypothetical protein
MTVGSAELGRVGDLQEPPREHGRPLDQGAGNERGAPTDVWIGTPIASFQARYEQGERVT